MNRPIGSGDRQAAGQRRMGGLASRPGSADRYRWRAAEVAAFTADPRHPALSRATVTPRR